MYSSYLISTFVVYAAVGNTLRPVIVFEALALFNVLRFPLIFLPFSFISLIQGLGKCFSDFNTFFLYTTFFYCPLLHLQFALFYLCLMSSISFFIAYTASMERISSFLLLDDIDPENRKVFDSSVGPDSLAVCLSSFSSYIFENLSNGN